MGRMLCNVVDGCTNDAVLQAPMACDQCQDVAAHATAKAQAAQAEADAQLAIMAQIEATVSAAQRLATDEETLRWVAARNAATIALSDAGAAGADALRLGEPHTHPKYACDDHVALLPAPIVAPDPAPVQ